MESKSGWWIVVLVAAMGIGCGDDDSTDESVEDAGGGSDMGSDMGGDGGGTDMGDETDGGGVDASASDAFVAPVETFVNPPEWAPDGDGVYQLRMEAAEVTIDGTTYCLRTWNGGLPGPTLRIAPQDGATERQVRVDFENAMTTADIQAVGPPGGASYDFNETNLHTHGLHVQPETATGTSFYGDNVLVHHAAGATAQYRFDIDEDQDTRGRPHEPGTFWYHPHVHGSTAIQVANGMAGALIVEGDVDSLAGIADANERIFVMTHIPLDAATPLAAGATCSDATLSVNDFREVAAAPTSVQVNGLIRPRLVLAPGAVERWRLIHGGVTQEMDLQLLPSTDADCGDTTGAPLDVHQIAQDGITFHAADERDHVFLAPGNRADLMVTAPDTEGTWCLAYEQRGMPGAPAETMVVAIVDVSSSAGAASGALPSDADLDATALPLLDCSGAVDGTQPMIFSQQEDELGDPCEGGPPGGLLFNVNCRTFDPSTPRVLGVDTLEEWSMNSEGGGAHPFHIHINPFFVCSGTIEGEALTPHWRDTVWVEESGSDTPSIVARYPTETYTGSFVTHCHKLHHEDQGMMELIRIDP